MSSSSNSGHFLRSSTTTSTASASGGSSYTATAQQHNNATTTPASSAHTDLQLTARLSQVVEEKEHRKITQESHRELLAAKLEGLRGLLQDIEADSWVYEKEDEQRVSSFPTIL